MLVGLLSLTRLSACFCGFCVQLVIANIKPISNSVASRFTFIGF
nr:MAG TPA: hypothetical protein [Caudoviricetes sp.]